MEDIEASVGAVLEQIRRELIFRAYSPGPTHVIVVVEMEQLSKDKLGIRHYLSDKEFVVALIGGDK